MNDHKGWTNNKRPNQRNNQRSNQPPVSITANYNFVPLAEAIHRPKWAEQISHDLPLADGLSGTLRYQLTAHTPILISSGREGESGHAHFYQLPNRRYAIPGSSIRGAMRAVLEIATFSAFNQVDDQWLSLRDLTPGARAIYGSKLTQNMGGAYAAQSRAGWLELHGAEWRVIPCDYSRIDHLYLDKHLPQPIGRCKTAQEKYRLWEESHHGQRTIWFIPVEEQNHPHSSSKLRYKKVEAIATQVIPLHCKQGELVFTGQPSKKKHMEFIFHDLGQPQKVPDRVRQSFLHIHTESAEWHHLRTRPRIPVFYLEDRGEIQSMGLAQMYRLPYAYTVHQTITHSHQAHIENRGTDFASLLFGYTDEQFGALKGRVSFLPAVADAAVQPKAKDQKRVVLNSPKPSFYPNYIAQNQQGGKLSGEDKPQYQTFSSPNARVRGWKRYPVRHALGSTFNEANNANIETSLHPLPAGTTFEGQVQFHNLKPEELGGLIWAMSWGGMGNYRHALGMGKPLGYGQSRIKIASTALEWDYHSQARALNPTQLIQRFTDYMKQVIPNWEQSPQIEALLMMATPEMAERLPLQPMKLADFREAKKSFSVLVNPLEAKAVDVPAHKPQTQPQKSVNTPQQGYKK